MVKTAAGFILLIAIVFILILGQYLLIPFIFALLIWLIMRKMRSALDHIPGFKIYVPLWVKTMISSVLLVFILISFGRLIEMNIHQLESLLPSETKHLNRLLNQIRTMLPVSFDDLQNNTDLRNVLEKYLTIFVNSLTSIVSNLFLILLYVIFLFLEESSFQQKLIKLFPKYTHHERTKHILEKIEASLSNYIGLKSLLALTAAILCAITLTILGVGAPVFWGLMVFLLYFIPTLGMFISSAFPGLFYFLITGDYYFAFTIFFTLLIIQGVMSNFLETKIMGNTLNVSPLVTIIALVFWGSIWGLTGMFLSVPITVILVLVFSHFPQTRSIAILLSEKGEIRNR